MTDLKKEGERQLKKMELEEAQKKEVAQAKKFTKVHKMGQMEAEEHMQSVRDEHKKQQERLKKKKK